MSGWREGLTKPQHRGLHPASLIGGEEADTNVGKYACMIAQINDVLMFGA
jgi:hypothetical protein